jgi:hypothetical protein
LVATLGIVEMLAEHPVHFTEPTPLRLLMASVLNSGNARVRKTLLQLLKRTPATHGKT